MIRWLTAVAAIALSMFAPAEALASAPHAPDVLLRYDPPLGQRAQYRVVLDVRGTQSSLGEKLPVKWKAEGELWEEVVARSDDGSFWLQVTGGPMTVTETNGLFANGPLGDALDFRLHVSPTGAVVERVQSSPADARGRALADLVAELAPAILPEAPVRPGDEWAADDGRGGRQANRLLSLEGTGELQIARIAARSWLPLSLDEGVAELGLATHLTGRAEGTSQLALEVKTGLVRYQKGRTHIVTQSRVPLSLPEGREAFLLESDLTVAFEVRLTARP